MTENILMSGISPSVLDSVESDPLSNRNYEAFKQAAIDLGFAHEYADGVTIISTN